MKAAALLILAALAVAAPDLAPAGDPDGGKDTTPPQRPLPPDMKDWTRDDWSRWVRDRQRQEEEEEALERARLRLAAEIAAGIGGLVAAP
jgi:hypothetical protein